MAHAKIKEDSGIGGCGPKNPHVRCTVYGVCRQVCVSPCNTHEVLDCCKQTGAAVPKMKETVSYHFTVAGNVDVDKSLKILRAHDGTIRGFQDLQGNELLPVLAFERAGKHPVLSTDGQLKAVGLDITDYKDCAFEPSVDNEHENEESGK